MELLADIGYIFQLNLLAISGLQVESDDAKIETVGIDAEVFGSGNTTLSIALGCLVLNGIDFRVTVTEVEGLLTFGRCQPSGVFELMPAPVGHSSQGHTCPVFKRERLQACDVDSRGEVAVADAE